MKVYWLEQTQADVPADDNWLGRFEVDRLSQMSVRKRRADWRLGRWTGKRAISARLGLSMDSLALAQIEIRAAASGAPEAFIADRPSEFTISLSHRSGIGLCAVADARVALGCDLELIEPRDDAFIGDYFTGEEQASIRAAVASEQAPKVALMWSGKESALKALQTGLRLDTRALTVRDIASPHVRDWMPLEVRHRDGQVFYGWWRRSGRLVRTVVAAALIGPPNELTLKAPSTERVVQHA